MTTRIELYSTASFARLNGRKPSEIGGIATLVLKDGERVSIKHDRSTFTVVDNSHPNKTKAEVFEQLGEGSRRFLFAASRSSEINGVPGKLLYANDQAIARIIYLRR